MGILVGWMPMADILTAPPASTIATVRRALPVVVELKNMRPHPVATTVAIGHTGSIPTAIV